MGQIDFAVAFLVMISVLTYSFVSVSNKLANDFNTFIQNDLDASASSLSKQLFKIQDDKSLISNFKKIQASFLEIGSYQHTNEEINVTITPVVNNIHVYDNFFNEISSTFLNNGDNVTVRFRLDFLPNEKKYVNIFYNDVPTTNIKYTNVTETNITSVILSEEDVYLLSQQRCNKLKSLSYENAKNEFGFQDNFRISECEYGGELPPSSNIIVKSTPLLVEGSTGAINSTFVRLRVWQ